VALRPIAALGRSLTATTGVPDASRGPAYRGAVLLAAVGAVLALGPIGLTLGFAGVAVAAVRTRSERARQSVRLLRELNDAVPLLQLGVAAGLTVRGCLLEALPWLRGRFADELSAAVLAAERGSSLADELDAVAARLGEVSRGVLVVLAAAERYGAPLGAPLALAAQDLRLKRRRQLEQAARRLPVRLLFPLAFGVLPAFVLLTVVPLVATSVSGLSLAGG
jgi:tight adherence protein C